MHLSEEPEAQTFEQLEQQAELAAEGSHRWISALLAGGEA